MRDRPKNVAQSVRDRLRAVTVRLSLDYNLILTRYVLERLLYRLSVSAHKDRFALKGAMLFVVWTANIIRPTQDLDLLGFGDSGHDALREAFRDIMSTPVPDDGVTFDLDSVQAEPIRAEQLYDGIRVSALAFIGTARVPIQIDIGFGDAITPGLEEQDYPTLLDAPAPRLRTYPRETVIAEKLEAIVDIGTRTSRMKDYYDLLFMARLFAFDGQMLSQAIRATFERRKTELPKAVPPALSQDFAADADAVERWNAFIRRMPLLVDPLALTDVVEEITRFVMPPAIAAALGTPFAQKWQPSMGWIAA
ncbi:nucleotidyl transferase AbiEii/AbiGii toxin family protein [Methyloceanibacter sp.]|uniref:nucleotidyl transferase AbiEii/AbiGii toxin family protein n=1 Tax=Methyloceanibacter sp. TaxID=1965321 RepID=UPI002D10C497|nr:nucleotidyl transferase AbiEii/AbiGii toxin family protein [Methyloceanibacter sp.]HML92936.1 nucleotidyl transferase AbiEii/AbiGii toxin family protein [Methyloceanibacter sp.]